MISKGIAEVLWPKGTLTENTDLHPWGLVNKTVTHFPAGEKKDQPRSWEYHGKVFLTNYTPKIDIINDVVNAQAREKSRKPGDFFVVLLDDVAGHHRDACNFFKQRRDAESETFQFLSVKTFAVADTLLIYHNEDDMFSNPSVNIVEKDNKQTDINTEKRS